MRPAPPHDNALLQHVVTNPPTQLTDCFVEETTTTNVNICCILQRYTAVYQHFDRLIGFVAEQ